MSHMIENAAKMLDEKVPYWYQMDSPEEYASQGPLRVIYGTNECGLKILGIDKVINFHDDWDFYFGHQWGDEVRKRQAADSKHSFKDTSMVEIKDTVVLSDTEKLILSVALLCRDFPLWYERVLDVECNTEDEDGEIPVWLLSDIFTNQDDLMEELDVSEEDYVNKYIFEDLREEWLNVAYALRDREEDREEELQTAIDENDALWNDLNKLSQDEPTVLGESLRVPANIVIHNLTVNNFHGMNATNNSSQYVSSDDEKEYTLEDFDNPYDIDSEDSNEF